MVTWIMAFGSAGQRFSPPIAHPETIQKWVHLLGANNSQEIVPGSHLFRQGELATHVFSLTTGLIVLSCALDMDNAGVLGLRVPGQIVEQCAHSLGIPYPVTATALVRSTVVCISVNELNTKKSHNADIASFFETMLSRDLYAAEQFIVQLKEFTPPQRLETFLLFLASVTPADRLPTV